MKGLFFAIGAFFCALFPFLQLSGQNVDQHSDIGYCPSFKDRIAIRTNVVDWVLTTPNIAFDYDVVNTPYDKKSVGLNLKYNWRTSHTYIPKQVYNLFDVRLDYRFYWRQQPYDEREDHWERTWLDSAKGFDKIRARISCFRGAEKPKQDISFFVGPYLSTSNFSFKFSAANNALGRQGTAFGAGLTGGIALPLYGYENGSALDLEFGGSVGWHFASYDLFSADEESNCYHTQGHRNHWVFYPLVTDMRVSLVYRFRTIAKQHKEVNYDLLDRRYVALLLERNRDSVRVYNARIKQAKDELDKRNRDVALYKKTVESQPGFNEAYSLEFLTPYVDMIAVPRKYTRRNKDTLPFIRIDSIEQITDRVLLDARSSIDAIPGMTAADIDKEFVIQYNNIVDNDEKTVLNRTELLRNIYYRLSDNYIKPSNATLLAGTFDTQVYSEKVSKFDVRTQKNVNTEITYKDSVRTIELTHNEKVEWRNSIKKRAWTDVQNRMRGIYIRRVAIPDTTETPLVDSVAIEGSIKIDSISIDSIKVDSIAADSIRVDGIEQDSLNPASVTIDAFKTNIAADTTAIACIGTYIPYRKLSAQHKRHLISIIKKEEDEE